MTETKHIESQEKFQHLFITINLALLGAAIQTVKFAGLGKWGSIFEILAWIFMAVSFLLGVCVAWDTHHIYAAISRHDWANETYNQGLKDDSKPLHEFDGKTITHKDYLLELAQAIDESCDINNRLLAKSRIIFRCQLAFIAVGIACLGFSRSIEGIMKIRQLW